MESISAFDIIVLACLLAALCIGIKKGFIAQVISLVALCLGVWLSVKFSAPLGQWLSGWTSLEGNVPRIIAFILISCVTSLGITLLGKVLETIVKVVLLGWLNRLLGAILAVFECLLILCILLMVFDALNETFSFVKNEYLASTKFYGPLKSMSYAIFPYMKELFFWK